MTFTENTSTRTRVRRTGDVGSSKEFTISIEGDRAMVEDYAKGNVSKHSAEVVADTMAVQFPKSIPYWQLKPGQRFQFDLRRGNRTDGVFTHYEIQPALQGRCGVNARHVWLCGPDATAGLCHNRLYGFTEDDLVFPIED